MSEKTAIYWRGWVTSIRKKSFTAEVHEIVDGKPDPIKEELIVKFSDIHPSAHELIVMGRIFSLTIEEYWETENKFVRAREYNFQT